MKKILLVCIFCCLLQACSGGKRANVLYTRPDIETQVSTVIVFPTTTADGTINDDTKLMSKSIYANWTNIYGKKAIPGDPVVEKMLEQKATREVYLSIVDTLGSADSNSIEKTLKSAAVKKFLQTITSKLGAGSNARFAISVIYGSEKGYDNGQPLKLNIGLFDFNGSTWKVITETESQKGAITTFKIDYNGIINQHFTSIEENIEQVK